MEHDYSLTVFFLHFINLSFLIFPIFPFLFSFIFSFNHLVFLFLFYFLLLFLFCSWSCSFVSLFLSPFLVSYLSIFISLFSIFHFPDLLNIYIFHKMCYELCSNLIHYVHHFHFPLLAIYFSHYFLIFISLVQYATNYAQTIFITYLTQFISFHHIKQKIGKLLFDQSATHFVTRKWHL